MREIDELTEVERQFEQALRSLRPAPAQIDAARAAAEVRRRARRRRRSVWRLAAAATLLVVAGAALWRPWQERRKPLDGVASPATRLANAEVDATTDAGPTQLVYRRALGRSAAELDAVLKRHGRGAPGLPPPQRPAAPVQAGVLTQWNPFFDTSLGD
jgi:hypothetical protein